MILININIIISIIKDMLSLNPCFANAIILFVYGKWILKR